MHYQHTQSIRHGVHPHDSHAASAHERGFDFSQPLFDHGEFPRPNASTSASFQSHNSARGPEIPPLPQMSDGFGHHDPSSLARRSTGVAVGYYGNEWDHEVADDDTSMIESDDEIPDSRDLLMPIVQKWDPSGTQMRAFSTFAHSNAVSEYMHSPHTTELKDSGMKTVFMHFVNVTGPSMSLYERHPFDNSAQEQAGPDENDGFNLWSCKFIDMTYLTANIS